jgi:hyperosmotically inducible periplasmic protein
VIKFIDGNVAQREIYYEGAYQTWRRLRKMRKTNFGRRVVMLMTLMFLLAPALSAFANTPQVNPRLVKQIRHELATLPYYGVFDWLEFEMKPDNTVVLRGYVTRPTTKSDAEARVKDIEGVKGVINEIQVLSVSPNDDRLRIALYRQLYNWDSPLFRYATQAIPSIHIIVDGGRAILKGVVDSKADAQLAYMRARSVPGLFDVKNELVIEGEGPGQPGETSSGE